MDKATLRNNLFNKYFEVDNGVLAIDLVDKLSFIPETWNRLHMMCEKHIEYFDLFSTLDKFKAVEHNQKKYLILKLRMFRYVIIDLENMDNMPEEQFKEEFDENFFISNFNEIKRPKNLFDLYDIYNYNGNVKELVLFYNENQLVF